MTNPTTCVMESFHACLMIYFIGNVINGVQSQLPSPVLVSESETASFRWQLPAAPGGHSILYVISPSGAAVLLANSLNNHQVLGNYKACVTYTGNLTADPKIMAFDLRSAVRSDAGTYTCGRNGVTDIIPDCGQKLVVLGQPTRPTLNGPSAPVFGRDGPYAVALQPSTLSYTSWEGQESVPRILCSATCKPVCTYKWLKNGTFHSDGATLTLLVSDRSQTGSYNCQASNTYGTVDSSSVLIDVTYQASIGMLTGNSLSWSVTVNESDPVTFRCELDNAGNPRSVIRLLNRSEELTRAENSLTATYRLESADCRQRGNYSCTATNNIGAPVSQILELLVKCSPRSSQGVAPQLKYSARLGGDGTLSLSVIDFPLPTFTWSRSISSIQDLTGSSSPVSDISVTARLHLTNLQQQDFGDYYLTVDNGVGGSLVYNFSLEPAGPPQTPAQFRDLDNATMSSVWLSWLPGVNGGHPQTFLIEYRQFPTRTWVVYNSYDDIGETMVVEVSGLISGEIYTFRLRARNDFGDSNRYVFVETTTAGDAPVQQKRDAPCTYTGEVAGATVGGGLLVLLIGGIVLMVLYRKVTDARKSRHPEPVEMDNRGYSSLDQINAPAQYSNLEDESEKQQYTHLKIYENTKADTAADTNTYEGVTETPPVTYESIRASPYQNTEGQSEGPHHRNN